MDVIDFNNGKRNNKKKTLIVVIAAAVILILTLVIYICAVGIGNSPIGENGQGQEAASGSSVKQSTWKSDGSYSSGDEAGSLVKGEKTTTDETVLEDPTHDFSDSDIDKVISSKKIQKKLNKIIESESYSNDNSKISKAQKIKDSYLEKNKKYIEIYNTISTFMNVKDNDVEFMANTYGFTKNYFMTYNFYYFHPGYDLSRIGPTTEDSPMLVNDRTDDTYYALALNRWVKEKASEKDPANSIIMDNLIVNKDIEKGQTDDELKQLISSLYDNNKEEYGKVNGKNVYNYPELGKLYTGYFINLDRVAFVKSTAYKFRNEKSSYVDIRKDKNAKYIICLNDNGKILGVKKK